MATLQNLGVLKYRDKDGNWKPLPVVLQNSSGGGSGGISTISGNGQPTASTVGRLNQLYRDELTDKLYICTGVEGGYTWSAVVSDTEDAVTYTAQTLTEEQKTQARANIGAGTSNFSGSYNDLSNKPNIPAASVIDTTLTKSGQAADAKAAGDAIGKKIDAPQTAAVGEVLTVEEVGEDGKPKKWKTQVVDVDGVLKYTEQELTDEEQVQARKNIRAKPIDFPVTITSTTTDGVTTYTADKTFAEIKAAYDSGANVYALLNGLILSMSGTQNDLFMFCAIVAGTQLGTLFISQSEIIIRVFDYSGAGDSNLTYLITGDYSNLKFYKKAKVLKTGQYNAVLTTKSDFINSISETGVNAVIIYNDIKYYCQYMDIGFTKFCGSDSNNIKTITVSYDVDEIEIIFDDMTTPLPSPTTAQVGQIVKVKAVDESGKITETETVDMNTSVTITYNEETGNLQIGD